MRSSHREASETGFSRAYFLLITLMFITLTSSCLVAAETCVDLFTITRLTASRQFKLLAEFTGERARYKKNPSVEVLREVDLKFMAIGRELLNRKKIEYSEVLNDGRSELIITPSLKTEFNKFAQMVKEVYQAEVRFSASDLVRIRAGAFVRTGEVTEEEGTATGIIAGTAPRILRHSLYLGWSHIVRALQFRFLRDTTILHELRHLRMHIDLLNNIASPFHGAVNITGIIPGDDPMSDDVYLHDMSFSEIKTFHTAIKEALTILRGGFRANGDDAPIDSYSSVVSQMALLAKIAHRAELVTDIMLTSEIVETSTLMIFGIVHLKAKVYLNNKSVVVVTQPLLKSQGLDDPQNLSLFRDQMSWTSATAKNAVYQSLLARRLFSRMFPIDSLEAIDAAQEIFGVGDLIAPEPSSPLNRK